jgi:hypothetical protein
MCWDTWQWEWWQIGRDFAVPCTKTEGAGTCRDILQGIHLRVVQIAFHRFLSYLLSTFTMGIHYTVEEMIVTARTACPTGAWICVVASQWVIHFSQWVF